MARGNKKRWVRAKRELQAAHRNRDLLDLRCDVEFSDVEAAAKDGETPLRKFQIKAYNGGPLNLWGWQYPVVIDLTGMKTRQAIPVLRDHYTNQIVGHTEEVTKELSLLTMSGLVSGAGPAAREVAQSSLSGFPWQASVGARVTKAVLVAEGKTATANGQTFTGPLYIARKSQLAEVSFVALGADENTSGKVAASAAQEKEDFDMKFEQWVEAQGFVYADLDEKQIQALRKGYDAAQAPEPAAKSAPATAGTLAQLDALASEFARGQAIEALAAQYAKECPLAIKALRDIAATAIENKAVDIKTVELDMLKATRAKTPDDFSVINRGRRRPTQEHYEAALAIAAHMPEIEKAYQPDLLAQAEEAFPNGLSLGEMLLAQASAHGYRGMSLRANLRQVLQTAFMPREIQAGFSTIDLSGILSNVANKFLLQSFNAVDQAWRKVSSIRSVKDFKQISSYRLTGDFTYEEIGPDGELKHGEASEETYNNQAKTYGRMFAITRQDLINDDLDALSQIARRIGRGGALKLNDVFWTAFMDNSTFFTTARLNYLAGAATALSITSLTAAEALFLTMNDADGTPLALTPRILLVPSALSALSAQLMKSLELRDTTASTKYPVANPHAGKFEPVTTPYLSNASYTGYSAAAWFLLASPLDLSVIETAFLNGQQEPTVESADADFNVLGIQFRGYHDFGCAKQDYRAGVKMCGA